MNKKEVLEAVTVIINECADEHKYHMKYGVETLKEAREAFTRDFNVISRLIDKLGDYEGYVETTKLYEELLSEMSEMGETYNSLKNKMRNAYFNNNSKEFFDIANGIMKEAEKLTEAEYYALLDVYENLASAYDDL